MSLWWWYHRILYGDSKVGTFGKRLFMYSNNKILLLIVFLQRWERIFFFFFHIADSAHHAERYARAPDWSVTGPPVLPLHFPFIYPPDQSRSRSRTRSRTRSRSRTYYHRSWRRMRCANLVVLLAAVVNNTVISDCSICNYNTVTSSLYSLY